MRPVNLLPDELRPRQRTSEGRGAAHVLIGVLGALLVLVVVYALTVNQTNSHRTDIAQAKSDIEQARAQADATSSFGDFHRIKETRLASVEQLAGGRFDWERLMRELALVLPRSTWLLDISASTSGTDQAGGAGAAARPTGSAGSTASTGASGGSTDAEGSSDPSLNLKGCALRQRDVAVLLVRLRKLHRAEDVDLAESAQEVVSGSGGQASTAGSGSESCGSKRFKFDVTVTFSPSQDREAPAGGKVPARLGGGS